MLGPAGIAAAGHGCTPYACAATAAATVMLLHLGSLTVCGLYVCRELMLLLSQHMLWLMQSSTAPGKYLAPQFSLLDDAMICSATGHSTAATGLKCFHPKPHLGLLHPAPAPQQQRSAALDSPHPFHWHPCLSLRPALTKLPALLP
jgi:hypothetical protein